MKNRGWTKTKARNEILEKICPTDLKIKFVRKASARLMPAPYSCSPNEVCPYCHGTGKIMLFTSIVDCECIS